MRLETRFLSSLSRGNVAQAEKLLAQSPDLSSKGLAKPSDVFVQSHQYQAQERLVLAAGQAPDRAALDWLIARMPELTPQGEQAVNLLGRLLEGRSDVRALWLADWLVENTPLVPHLAEQRAQGNHVTISHLTFRALNRSDTEGLAWLLHPPASFPVWEDNPDDPILARAVAHGSNYNPDQRAKQMVYLLRHGVRPLITTAPANPKGPGNSPLQILMYDYEEGVAEWERSGKPVKAGLETLVATVWPLLVQAGDDPDRRLGNRQTAREMIRNTPLQGLAVAMDRVEALTDTPSQPQRRSRLRS